MGVVAGDGGAIIWPLLVGPARAKQFLLTGDSVSADEAKAMGLVNVVVAPRELTSYSRALAQRLAAGPALAIRGTKASVNKLLREAVNLVLDTSLAREKECFASMDHHEAIKAFRAKRQPKFIGAR